MTDWIQTLIVALAIASCAGYIGWQAMRTLRGGRGGLGACCSKGCSAMRRVEPDQKIVFLPVESLRKK